MRTTVSTLAAIALTAALSCAAAAEGRKIDVPIMLGGNEKFDACSSEGQIVGLKPGGDGFLSVRSGPGARPYREIDRLYNGNRVAICDDDGPWYAVVYESN